MGYFYFDESIRERGRFIVGAYVYSEKDLTPRVFDALKVAGMHPMVDEFKSGMRMDNNLPQIALRDTLGSILHDTRIGMMFSPIADRGRLGQDALNGLSKILRANKLVNSSHNAYFDSGIRITTDCRNQFYKAFPQCNIYNESDSKQIGGIQLADLAAHSIGTILLSAMGLSNKNVRANPESGYTADTKLELDYFLWASIRHSFFLSPTSFDPDSLYDDSLMFDMENYAVHISENCNDELRETIKKRFGECFLGCIH